MNKILIAALALVSACSTYKRGMDGMNIKASPIEVRPLEATVKVGERLSGVSQCVNIFGIPVVSSDRRVYGATLQTVEGVDADCANDALYNAVSAGQADLIIAPQYTSVETNFGCLFDRCIYRNVKVDVRGFKGTYESIKPMSDDVVNARFKAEKKD